MTTSDVKRWFLCLVAAAVTAGALSACASTPDPSPEEFIDVKTSTLLGQTQSKIERDLKPRRKGDDGWVSYTSTFKIQYSGQKAIALREKIPDDLGCREAAKWLGFTRARTPILEKGKCSWPTDSARHGLGKKNLSGSMNLKTRVFIAKMH